MIKKIVSIAFIFSLFTLSAAKASVSSIMVDAKNGEVLYESNADEARYPASLTKLMTLYITFNALENNHIKLTDKLKVSSTAAGRSPSKLGVKAGETISVKDAIMAVIVKSANDCATVLAEHFSKSEADFAVLMTNTAKKLGMKHTVFKNASGLPNSAQKTTARDMATLSMAVYHHFPQYYKWFSANSFVYKGKTITGHNHVLKTFAGADGMKTGYTAAAGYNIVTSAKRNDNRVIAVTMGHKYLNDRDKKVSVMMDNGLKYLHNDSGLDSSIKLADAIEGNKASVAPIASPEKKATVIASSTAKETAKTSKVAESHTPTSSGRYALQVGSFSDYNRAKSYALSVKNKVAQRYNIKVEKVQADGNTLFRSKVVGLAKQDAVKICNNMKRNKQSCFVVADKENMKVAQK